MPTIKLTEQQLLDFIDCEFIVLDKWWNYLIENKEIGYIGKYMELPNSTHEFYDYTNNKSITYSEFISYLKPKEFEPGYYSVILSCGCCEETIYLNKKPNWDLGSKVTITDDNNKVTENVDTFYGYIKIE